jgi:hypothetical protein
MKDENMLRIFERRILRKIYGSIKDNNAWISMYNHKLYQLYNENNYVWYIEVAGTPFHNAGAEPLQKVKSQ